MRPAPLRIFPSAALKCSLRWHSRRRRTTGPGRSPGIHQHLPGPTLHRTPLTPIGNDHHVHPPYQQHPADRPSLDPVYWGDGTQSFFVRQQKIDQNDISKNIYINTHTYAGNGSFKIYLSIRTATKGGEHPPRSMSCSPLKALIVGPVACCPEQFTGIDLPRSTGGCVGPYVHTQLERV